MKISTEHYSHMKEKIKAVAEKLPAHRAAVIAGNPERYGPGGTGDIEKRVRWDALQAAGLIPWICDTLYPAGLNDDHIDTALRAVMREVAP
jgi:hypothetical protein